MTLPEELDFESASARIGFFMAAIAGLGTLVALAAWGWKWAAGFLVGALISGFNFRWLHRLVDSLGGGRRRRAGSVFLAFRFLILAGSAYAILRFTSISLPAVLAGLFVLTAAVFVEVLYELTYARK